MKLLVGNKSKVKIVEPLPYQGEEARVTVKPSRQKEAAI